MHFWRSVAMQKKTNRTRFQLSERNERKHWKAEQTVSWRLSFRTAPHPFSACHSNYFFDAPWFGNFRRLLFSICIHQSQFACRRRRRRHTRHHRRHRRRCSNSCHSFRIHACRLRCCYFSKIYILDVKSRFFRYSLCVQFWKLLVLLPLWPLPLYAEWRQQCAWNPKSMRTRAIPFPPYLVYELSFFPSPHFGAMMAIEVRRVPTMYAKHMLLKTSIKFSC